jgi:hypothetical protein
MKSIHETLPLHIDLVTRSQVDEVLQRIAARYKVVAYRVRRERVGRVDVVIEVGLVGWLLGRHRRARADYLEVARSRGVEIIDYTATARLNLRIDAAALRRAWDRMVGRRAEDFIRAGNDVACQVCGRPYWQHPQDSEHEWLVVRCDGQRLKL